MTTVQDDRLVIGVGVGVASSVAAVVALALYRLRRCGQPAASAVQQQQQQHQDMEWDNSTFNITVNPLDAEDGVFEEFDGETVPVTVQGSDDVEPSGDELDVEAGVGKRGCKELEWDDSTLNY